MFNRKTWFIAFAAILIFSFASFAAVEGDLAGKYQGVFTGAGNYGVFHITVNPDGSINGTGQSQIYSRDLVFQGRVSSDGTTEFYTVEGADIPMYFNGRIDFMKRLLGKWEYQDNSAWGSFNGLIQ
jgi:hypothetical protein